jgi:hypothetical protein
VISLSGPAAEQRLASYPPDTVSMMWGSAWKTDRVNAQAHLRASRRVRTLADVELLAARLVEEH